VGEFFFEYGLFAAKVLTVLIIILLAVLALTALLSSREQEREAIEIDKLNDKFDAMREALENELLSKDELKIIKKQKKKEDKEEQKSLKKRIKQGLLEPTRSRLFLIRFVGDMHATEVDNLRETVTAILSVAKDNDEVLVCIDSPGGLVHSYGLAASQLKRIRDNNIELTASVDLIAASGGYLMACVANKIIAAPFAVVGSIGVVAQIPNFNRLLDKHNVDIEQHTAGEYKTTLTMLGKNTDKARKKFREELEDTHVLFKQFVQEHRPQLDIQKFATGEHWYGSQALNLHLIDEVTTSDDYLLNKSETADIYEVSYVIAETLKDKISSFFNGITSHALQSVWKLLVSSKRAY
jgi:serine protease SohB